MLTTPDSHRNSFYTDAGPSNGVTLKLNRKTRAYCRGDTLSHVSTTITLLSSYSNLTKFPWHHPQSFKITSTTPVVTLRVLLKQWFMLLTVDHSLCNARRSPTSWIITMRQRPTSHCYVDGWYHPLQNKRTNHSIILHVTHIQPEQALTPISVSTDGSHLQIRQNDFISEAVPGMVWMLWHTQNNSRNHRAIECRLYPIPLRPDQPSDWCGSLNEHLAVSKWIIVLEEL